MKECTKCHIRKPFEEFYKPKSAKVARDGYTYWCKQCYKNNYDNHRDRQKLSNRKASIRRRYGLSLEEYEALMKRGCAVCGNKARGRIVLDHCHATDSVREPLCDGCNKALGCADDDPKILRDLAVYLERHNTVHT